MKFRIIRFEKLKQLPQHTFEFLLLRNPSVYLQFKKEDLTEEQFKYLFHKDILNHKWDTINCLMEFQRIPSLLEELYNPINFYKDLNIDDINNIEIYY